MEILYALSAIKKNVTFNDPINNFIIIFLNTTTVEFIKSKIIKFIITQKNINFLEKLFLITYC
jgi:hypothetical protein